MKLYPIPGGAWAGTEADWKKACKARGLDPKTLRGAREVPTGKAELLEFLNFNAVDVYRTVSSSDVVVQPQRVDVAALRATHNPDGASEADRQLGAMDNPGVDIEAVVEFACNARGAALKRIAGAVAQNFAALAAA